jgi:hypothetical protein
MPSNNTSGNLTPLSRIRDLAFFFAAYLYFIGFVFQHYLYAHFGIPVVSLQIPFYYFFVFSYTVITKHAALTILIVFSAIVIEVVKELLDLNPFWRFLITTLFLSVLFPAAFGMAKRTGEGFAEEMRMGQYVKPITFVLRSGAADAYPQPFTCANKNKELRLLAETEDSFYVLDQSEGTEQEVPSGFTYVVRREDVRLARIWLQNFRKPGAAK